MAFRKTHDLAVRTGSYTGSDGKEKGRYENVGHVLTGDDGGKLYCLKRTFNPAGVPNPEGRDTVVLSVFEVREVRYERGSQAPTQQQRAEVERSRATPVRETAPASGGDPFSDEIPFGPHGFGSVA